MISYIIILVLIVLLLVAYLTIGKTAEKFTMVTDPVFLDKLANKNLELREEIRQKKLNAYGETQRLNLDKIEDEVNKFDNLLRNIQSSLSSKNIPICREIDLKQKSVEGDKNPCTKRSKDRCELNPYCKLDKNASDEFVCKLKDFNSECKDIIQEVETTLSDGSKVKEQKITKLFLYPKTYEEITNLKIIG
jgi:hypothetical protein